MLYLAIYTPPGKPRPPRQIIQDPDLAEYVQAWGRPGDEGLIAFETTSGQPAGAAWLRLWTGEHKGYGYLNDQTPEVSIALLPEHRQQGLGTRLLTTLLAQASGRYPALSLSVIIESPAVRLYHRLGFTVVDEVLEMYVMVKVLS